MTTVLLTSTPEKTSLVFLQIKINAWYLEETKQEQIIEKFYNLAQKVLTGMNSELYCYYCIGKQKGLDENIYFLFKAETKKEVSLLKNLIYININILTNNVKYTCEADIMMKNRLIEYRLLTTVINADSWTSRKKLKKKLNLIVKKNRRRKRLQKY